MKCHENHFTPFRVETIEQKTSSHPLKKRRKNKGHSSNRFKSFPDKTNDPILIKFSKTLILSHFPIFRPFWANFQEEPDLVWPFNIRGNEEEHNNNRLKWFPVETNHSILIKDSKT